MKRTALPLFAVSAFSSFPSPFYRELAPVLGSIELTTAVLFAAHGIAAILAMTTLTLAPVTKRIERASTGAVLSVLVLMDAAAGLLFVVASGPGEFAFLFAARLLTGAVLGCVTVVATSKLAQVAGGTGVATAGILGGVGLGALAAASLAAVGASRPWVFAAGVIVLGALAAVSWFTREPNAVRIPARAENIHATPLVIACAGLAFLANGVLGLFTSVLPGIVAGSATDGALAAGLTVAATLLAAGAARLLVPANRQGTARVLGVGALATGTLLFAVGLSTSSIPLALVGGVLLGAAAGLGYEAAISTATSKSLPAARVAVLARVQRGGQLGLVIPVLLYPLAISH